MKRPFAYLLVFSLLICNSCGSSYEQLDNVTGLALFDINAAPIGRWNIPNDKRGESTVYPNPGNGNVFIFTSFPISKIWVIEADCSASTDENILEQSEELSYTVSEVEPLSVLTLELNSATEASLDMTKFSPGFYRVFYESDAGELYWQNIFIDPSVIEFLDYALLDEACG